MEESRTLIAKEWITKLANGINPLDNSNLREDDIVNNVHISRCLFYVAELIDASIHKKARKSKEYELPIDLTSDQISQVAVVERCGITAFVREINRVIPANMKPLTSASVLNWLKDNGFLQECAKNDGGKTKRPTASGNSIGITTENKVGPNGPYVAVEYDANAQRFILDNIYAIIDTLREPLA